MLSIASALERAEIRMDRLEMLEPVDGSRLADIGDALPALCVGSDVRPEQLHELLTTLHRFLGELVEGAPPCGCEDSQEAHLNCNTIGPIAAVLARAFWIGYEVGKAEED